MTKAELKDLMEYLAAIDNRQLTTEKMRGWFDIIGFLDYEVARKAVIECQRDPAISYVEPKHIIAYSRKVKEDIKTEQRRMETYQPETRTHSRMPKCVHNIGLLLCDDCCRQAAIKAGMIPAQRVGRH